MNQSQHEGDNFDDEGFEQLSPLPSSKEVKAPSDKPRKAAKSNSGPSLKARAIGYLSRREHSRAELARKLQPYTDPDNPHQLDQLLDELAQGNWQSDQRFAQSLLHRRAPKKGAALVLQELRQHGLPASQLEELRHDLEASELDRAREVWQRKFGQPPADKREYAKQYRFLASRGFSARCLNSILGELDD